MPLTEDQIEAFASRLHEAQRKATPVPMLTLEAEDMTLEEAYTTQRGLMSLRRLEGETDVGMKMGLTSKAKMEQVGVHQPIYGHLTSGMHLLDGEVLVHGEHCHPRCEPEIAFILGKDLTGPVTTAEALLAVDGVCAALEIIDSRYKDFKFRLEDVVADNASSSHFVLGSTVKKPDAVDLGNLGMVMEQNEKVVQTGSSAAIYEHPARSLATLANLLAARGEGLKAGSIVLAGGATAAVPLQPGDRIRLRVDGLGGCGFSVK